MALPAGGPRLLVALAVACVDADVPDRGVGALLRRRLRADDGGSLVRLGACRRSRSSGTSPGTSLTAARRASAAGLTTRRAPGVRWACAARSTRAARPRTDACIRAG